MMLKQLNTFIANNRTSVRNLLLGIYYLIAHAFLSRYSTEDTGQLPAWAAWSIIILLLVEPFSIRAITNHEAWKSPKENKGLPLGIISGSFTAVARIVFRLLFILAALPVIVPSYYFDHPATMYIIGILALKEIMTWYALTKPKPAALAMPAENIHQFILWNISCIFLFIFDESLMRHLFYNDAGTGNSMGMMVFFSAFLFLVFYLPNRIVELYADWVDLRGSTAKVKYLLSVIWFYLLMLATP